MYQHSICFLIVQRDTNDTILCINISGGLFDENLAIFFVNSRLTSMSSTALKLYWSKIKEASKRVNPEYYKYFLAFSIGSITSALFSLWFTKYITGWSFNKLLMKLFIKNHERNFRNIVEYKGFSVNPSPMRPSTELITWDSLFRDEVFPMLDRQDHVLTVEEIKTEYVLKNRAKFMAERNAIRTLSPFTPDPIKVTIKQSSFNNTGPVEGYIVTYPGTKIENGVIYYIHGGGFFMGYAVHNYIRF